jgi:AraC-like DNA-binding protein
MKSGNFDLHYTSSKHPFFNCQFLVMQFNRFTKKSCGRSHSFMFEIDKLETFDQEHQTGEGDAFLLPQQAYTYIWIEQGSGEVTIDLRRYIIEDNSIFYLKPGQAFSANIAEPAKGFVISFTREFADLYDKSSADLNRNTLVNPIISIESETYDFMKNLVAKMWQEFKNHHHWRAEVLRGFLRLFIIYISRQQEEERPANVYSRKVELVNRFFALLEKNYSNKKMVQDYAKLLAVTPGYLNETVKEISGSTASNHIQERIILEAKRLAIFEGDSMKEIAYSLGFCDPAHFSKYFKNISGTNFTDFKKNAISFC